MAGNITRLITMFNKPMSSKYLFVCQKAGEESNSSYGLEKDILEALPDASWLYEYAEQTCLLRVSDDEALSAIKKF